MTLRKSRGLRFGLIWLTLLVPRAAVAQVGPPDDLSRRIEQLEARVKELETLLAGVRALQTPAVPVAPVTPAADTQGDADAADSIVSTEQSGAPTLRLRGFTDVQLNTAEDADTHGSFVLGQFDLFISSQLSEKFNLLSELVVEANEKNEFGFEIERALLQYSQNDYLNVDVGRYHTAIGYYNTAYHHGSWFATAVDRPTMFLFEDQGGILPIHSVGVSANGRIPSGGLGLRYVAEVGNGRAFDGPETEAVQTVVDNNSWKALNLGFQIQPARLPGFRAGASMYRDHITPARGTAIHENIAAAFVVYEGEKLELLNEAILIKHSPAGSRSTFNTSAFYVQAGRRFGKSRPYVRYQYLDAPESEPLFEGLGRRSGPSIGLRYDVARFVALKAQYDRRAHRHAATADQLMMQLSLTF